MFLISTKYICKWKISILNKRHHKIKLDKIKYNIYVSTVKNAYKYVIKRLSRKNLHNLTVMMNMVRIGWKSRSKTFR